MSGLVNFLQEWVGALVSLLGGVLLFVAGWLRAYTAAVDKRQTSEREKAVDASKARVDALEHRIDQVRGDLNSHEQYVAREHVTRAELRETLGDIKTEIRHGYESLNGLIGQLIQDRMNKPHDGNK